MYTRLFFVIMIQMDYLALASPCKKVYISTKDGYPMEN